MFRPVTRCLLSLYPKASKLTKCSLCSSNLTKTSQSILKHEWKEEMIQILQNQPHSDEIIYNPCLDTKIEPLTDDCDPEYIQSLKPAPPPTFNLAAYANTSPIFEKMIKLGVDLFKIEKSRNKAEYILSLDFDRDVKNHLIFLHDHGVESCDLGHFITINPYIFKELIENLQIRIKYLELKKFNKESIARIIVHNPKHLSYSIKEVDAKLGSLQREFDLFGHQIRIILTKLPTILNLHKMEYAVKKFCLLEEMSFSQEDIKHILVTNPAVLESSRKRLVRNFDYLHYDIGISQDLIKKFPDPLVIDKGTLEARCKYLKKLKRDQFNPTKPGYVPLKALTSQDDREFIENYCHTSVGDYNQFLKTL